MKRALSPDCDGGSDADGNDGHGGKAGEAQPEASGDEDHSVAKQLKKSGGDQSNLRLLTQLGVKTGDRGAGMDGLFSAASAGKGAAAPAAGPPQQMPLDSSSEVAAQALEQVFQWTHADNLSDSERTSALTPILVKAPTWQSLFGDSWCNDRFVSSPDWNQVKAAAAAARAATPAADGLEDGERALVDTANGHSTAGVPGSSGAAGAARAVTASDKLRLLKEPDKRALLNQMTEKLKRILYGSDGHACRAAAAGAPMDEDGEGGAGEGARGSVDRTEKAKLIFVVLGEEAKEEIMGLLNKLEQVPVTIGLLGQTTIARLMQQMKKHPDEDLPPKVKPIVKRWKALFAAADGATDDGGCGEVASSHEVAGPAKVDLYHQSAGGANAENFTFNLNEMSETLSEALKTHLELKPYDGGLSKLSQDRMLRTALLPLHGGEGCAVGTGTESNDNDTTVVKQVAQAAEHKSCAPLFPLMLIGLEDNPTYSKPTCFNSVKYSSLAEARRSACICVVGSDAAQSQLAHKLKSTGAQIDHIEQADFGRCVVYFCVKAERDKVYNDGPAKLVISSESDNFPLKIRFAPLSVPLGKVADSKVQQNLDLRKVLVAYFEKHNTNKSANVEKLLHDYFGCEHLLIQKIESKYGEDIVWQGRDDSARLWNALTNDLIAHQAALQARTPQLEALEVFLQNRSRGSNYQVVKDIRHFAKMVRSLISHTDYAGELDFGELDRGWARFGCEHLWCDDCEIWTDYEEWHFGEPGDPISCDNCEARPPCPQTANRDPFFHCEQCSCFLCTSCEPGLSAIECAECSSAFCAKCPGVKETSCVKCQGSFCAECFHDPSHSCTHKPTKSATKALGQQL